MQETVGKMRTRITPNMDTFYEVIIVSNFHIPKAEILSHQYRVRANLTKESLFCTSSNTVKGHCYHHIETSKVIYNANQQTGFYRIKS